MTVGKKKEERLGCKSCWIDAVPAKYEIFHLAAAQNPLSPRRVCVCVCVTATQTLFQFRALKEEISHFPLNFFIISGPM